MTTVEGTLDTGNSDSRTRLEGPNAAAGSVESFGSAVLPYYDGLVRRLVMVLSDSAEAEDIAQETYVRAFRAWERFDRRDVRGWLYTIALRLAFNELRRRKRWMASVRRAHRLTWSDPVDPDLWAAIQRLDARTRATLLLNTLDGYTQREIALMLGVREGTVSSWLSRARKSLRTSLEPR